MTSLNSLNLLICDKAQKWDNYQGVAWVVIIIFKYEDVKMKISLLHFGQ